MRVWFLARGHAPFSPATIQKRQIGGGEIALYYVTKGLAGLGHHVVVVNRCGAEAGLYDGVRYYDAATEVSQWRMASRTVPPDVLVVCRRMPDVLGGIPARARVFWAHDYQGVPVATLRPGLGRQFGIIWRRTTGPLFHQRVDRIVVISRFLADVFRWLFRAPIEKLAIIPLGIEADLFAGPFGARVPMRFIQTSVPDRGLAPLLQGIFPAIRQRLPDAELHVYSYHPLDTYKKFVTPGVQFHGWVPKSELVQSLRESALMLYPATVEEMGCIAVLESMAAGTPAVTSSLGVLPELAGEGSRGIAVEGWPGTPNFADRFVEAATALLSDTHRLERMRAAAHDYAMAHHNWGTVAERWHQMLHDTLDAAAGR